MHWRRDDISDPAHTTCQWLLEHESYRTWYKDAQGLLWIKGNPGAGKSTVLKQALEAAKQNDEGLILASFFFHGRGSLIQKSPLGLFRSLLHQILQQLPGLLTEFASLYHRRCDTEGRNGQKWDWRERDLQNFFTSRVTETAKTLPMRIYIDALDECGQDPAISLVEFFSRVADSVAICFACRHYPIISLEEAGIEISVEQKNAPDIDTYITRRIQAAVQNEKSATSIRHELIERSAGNFQWVVLVTPRVIQFYRYGKSLSAICTLIRRLPSELASLYEEIVRGAKPDDMRQALHLFQWICFAFRPLTLSELREATALDIHSPHTSLKESRTSGQYAETDEDMERRVVSLSQGLVEVETHGSERIVQFVHQSVMDFLLQQGFHLLFEQLPDEPLKGSIIARGHFLISRACIKYISMDEVSAFRLPAKDCDPQLHRFKKHSAKFRLIVYAVQNWIAHAEIVEQENVVQDDLVALLQPTSSAISALHYLVRVSGGLRSNQSRNWRAHIQGMTLIHVASRFGLLSVISCILERDTRNTEVAARDNWRQTPLHHAAEAGHEAIVRQLLNNKADKNAKDSTDCTPMHVAAREGHTGVVDCLLEVGAALELRDRNGQTPLLGAILGRHADVVRLLLQRGAKVDTVNVYGETPLLEAVRGFSLTIAELLLENGAQVNTTSTKGDTPILCAVDGGHESMVRLLLEHGADPHSITDEDISYATMRGHHSAVEVIRCAKQAKRLSSKNQTPHNQVETVVRRRSRKRRK